MSGPFDKKANGTIREAGPARRPKDAATLILVRRCPEGWTVLMGKRSARHVFMPQKFVFPGGAVDPFDARAQHVTNLGADCARRLQHGTRRVPRAFPLTAIRETFEETGLVVGRPARPAGRAPAGWESYFAQGAGPCLADLRYVGRAVTPPHRPRRYDARFFMADADKALIDDRPPVDGAELSGLSWLSLDEALELDLPTVTRFMLAEINDRLEGRDAPGTPYLRWLPSGPSEERI